ncbi:hypothetical protein FQA39_LY18657 [Lamprigera yunnana]|nr:hypothetical protein FQA39_LY18657 [Lamprigera yunnana]
MAAGSACRARPPHELWLANAAAQSTQEQPGAPCACSSCTVAVTAAPDWWRSATVASAVPWRLQSVVKGTAKIETSANGSIQTGHAVLAGIDNYSCGPLGLPFYACRAVPAANAKIELSGPSNILTTHGQSAAAIYATAKGDIKAGNVNIDSSGVKAYGIRAERIKGTWYYDRSTSGPFDYSGTVELTGNVAVKATAADAYAFHADSFDGASGNDQLGKPASIRASGRDKVYTVQGNMLATKAGLIDLWMANTSQFTGASAVTNNGVIQLGIEGAASAWNMTANSSLTSLQLRSGASLLPVSNGTPFAYTLQGDVQSAGRIGLANKVVGDSPDAAAPLHRRGGRNACARYLPGRQQRSFGQADRTGDPVAPRP